MQHSVKGIGNDYEEIAIMRNDTIKFNADEFFQFAKDNKEKYGIIENGDDLLVSSWHSNSLIKDYQSMIRK